MRRENFYRRDPGLALQGMSSMSLEERGVYNTVIDLLYLTWRPLEDDRGYIAGHCRCAVQKLNPILNRLIAAGKLVTFVEGGRSYISNPTFERERTAVKGAAKTRSCRGEVGEKSAEVGEKSEGVENNSPLLWCDVEENQHDKALEKSRVEKTIDNPPTPQEGGQGESLFGDKPDEPEGRRRPKVKLPAGLPTAEQVSEAQAKARAAGANVDMAYQAERFRNWAESKDARYADWGRTWANWALKSIQDAPKVAIIGAAKPAATQEDRNAWWDRRVAEFRKSRHWNEVDWGPRPGRDGCKVPAEILAKHGYSAKSEGEAA